MAGEVRHHNIKTPHHHHQHRLIIVIMNDPLLPVPNEILFEIAKYLPNHSVIALLKTCRAMYPLHRFLLVENKNDILIFAARRNELLLLNHALSVGADVSYSTPCDREQRTALHYAARNNHTAIITQLLQYNPPLDQCDCDGFTPLLLAAYGGYQEPIDLLLDAGCNPDISRGAKTLLIAAIQFNLESIAITYIYQMDAYALDQAMEHKRLHITQLMFARGIALTEPPPIHRAARSGLEYVKLCMDHGADPNLLGDEMDGSPISLAAICGDTDIIEYLLQHGANPDVHPMFAHPFPMAVCNDNVITVQKFLDHGVDVAAVRKWDPDFMYDACSYSSGAIVRLLLDAFEELGMSESLLREVDLLDTAVWCCKVDVIKILLGLGVSVETVSRRGRTPLYQAAGWGRLEVVKALLEGGADPTIMCHRVTPLIRAHQSKHGNQKGPIMAAMLRAGADINELDTATQEWVRQFMV